MVTILVRVVLACVGLFLFFSGTAQAAIPLPMPESTGTIKTLSPGQSVDAAVDSATPGTRIRLQAGSYSGNIETAVDGSASNPITLESVPGATAVIKGSFKSVGASYLRVRNIKFDGAGTSGWGTSIWSSHHIEYSGLEITGFPGIAQGVLMKEGANDIWLFNNRIHDMGGAWDHHEHGLYLENGARAYIYNNLIYNMRAGYGIQFWGNYDDAQIINNTISNSELSGITIGGNAERGYPDRALIANNIIANHTRSSDGEMGFGITSYQPGSGNTVRNNLLYNNARGDSNINCGACSKSGNITGNPLFVGGTDFHLQSGSPAIDKATTEGIATDADGKARDAKPDLGAYERGGTTPDPTPTPTPEPSPTPTPTPSPTPTPTPPPTSSTNLALNKEAKASSVEKAGLEANKGNDGSTSTRWGSAFGAGEQWWSTDLGASYDLSKVTISWEWSGAKAYDIQVSDNGSDWKTVASDGVTTKAVKATAVTGTGRYLRILAKERVSTYGYSFYEISVEGTAAGTTPDPTPTPSPTTGFSPGLNSSGNPNVDPAALAKVDAKLVRMEWDINSAASNLDQAVDAYWRQGIRVQPLAGFYQRTPTQAEAQNLATWAQRFGEDGSFWVGKANPLPIKAIEFGNETSYGYQYGNDGPSSSSYQTRARAYGARVRDAEVAIPDVTKVGLLAQGDDANTGSNVWVDQMFAGTPDLTGHVTGWVIHPYGQSYVNRVDRMVSQLRAEGVTGTVPIDITEWGLATDNGRCLSDNYGWNRCMGYSEAGSTATTVVNTLRDKYEGLHSMLIYQVRDQRASGATSEREHYFGVLKQDSSDKGAYTTAIKQLMAL